MDYERNAFTHLTDDQLLIEVAALAARERARPRG
jgi:hypothetical protein